MNSSSTASRLNQQVAANKQRLLSGIAKETQPVLSKNKNTAAHIELRPRHGGESGSAE